MEDEGQVPSHSLSEPKALVGVPRGWRILMYVLNDLLTGWANLGETFGNGKEYL